MIETIVGRCHVGDSNRKVIRYLISRLKHGYATWRTLPTGERKRILHAVVDAHSKNRALYHSVMTGRF